MTGQLLQVSGALLVLAAFALAQVRVLSTQSLRYLVANLVGAAILAVEAYLEAQWGFLLLEGAWALVSAWGLAARVRASGPSDVAT